MNESGFYRCLAAMRQILSIERYLGLLLNWLPLYQDLLLLRRLLRLLLLQRVFWHRQVLFRRVPAIGGRSFLNVVIGCGINVSVKTPISIRQKPVVGLNLFWLIAVSALPLILI